MAADVTVEWGDDGRRARLIDRLFGDPATSPIRRVSAPALVCGVIAAALFAVAEVLPWMTVERAFELGGLQTTVLANHETTIEGVAEGVVTAYYLGVVLLLTLVGAALVCRPHARRILGAAGFGLAAGLLVVIVGLIGRASRGGVYATFYNVDAVVETGPYIAVAAVVAACAALALSGWHPRRSIGRRKPADAAADAEPGPIDLTVSSA
jgi:hypothetical protein